MKKKIVISLVATLGLTTSAFADEAALLKIINKLENRITELEKKSDSYSEKAPVSFSDFQNEQEAFNDELESRVDSIETATLVNKINFGLEFRTRVDSFHQETAGGVKGSQSNIWSNRLRLNMASDITDHMKFTGRLSMYKNWADNGNYAFSAQDPMQGRRPSDSRLYVERAYVDWTVLDDIVPLTFTIGRQPSSDGPSHQFKDNTVRKATYSALSFDGAADGIVATANLQKLTGVENMALRLGYGKGFQENIGTSYIGNPNGIKDTNVLGLFFDTGLGIDGSLMQLSAVKGSQMISNTTNLAGTSTNANIGDVTLYTAMLEFTNLADTGLDVFAHGAISRIDPNGETGNQAVDTNGDGVADTDIPMGLLSNTPGNTQSQNGYAYWLGSRYTLPFEKMHNPKIGVEFNHGSQYWFSFTQGSNDSVNKLATRGDATEFYYIQPINRYANLRIGAQFIKYDYTGSGYQIGAPLSIDNPQAANQLERLQNYYFLFNVMY